MVTFRRNDEWAPDSKTIAGWLAKIKPMQHNVFSKTCVDSFINCFIRNVVSRSFNGAPSVVVAWLFDQFLDLALKSPINSTKSEWPLKMSKIRSTRLVRNVSNSSDVWLGDQYEGCKRAFLRFLATIVPVHIENWQDQPYIF